MHATLIPLLTMLTSPRLPHSTHLVNPALNHSTVYPLHCPITLQYSRCITVPTSPLSCLSYCIPLPLLTSTPPSFISCCDFFLLCPLPFPRSHIAPCPSSHSHSLSLSLLALLSLTPTPFSLPSPSLVSSPLGFITTPGPHFTGVLRTGKMVLNSSLAQNSLIARHDEAGRKEK